MIFKAKVLELLKETKKGFIYLCSSDGEACKVFSKLVHKPNDMMHVRIQMNLNELMFEADRPVEKI